jgi:hypothetical protein
MDQRHEVEQISTHDSILRLMREDRIVVNAPTETHGVRDDGVSSLPFDRSGEGFG